MKDVVVNVIKAYEVLGILALENSLNQARPTTAPVPARPRDCAARADPLPDVLSRRGASLRPGGSPGFNPDARASTPFNAASDAPLNAFHLRL
jgi:hypothetical protein